MTTARAAKAAIVFVCDIGPTMWSNGMHEGDETRLEFAGKIVSKMLHNKIIQERKSDRVGLVLVGANGKQCVTTK
jgi:hypothetical protein